MINFGHGVFLDALDKDRDMHAIREWRNHPEVMRWCRQRSPLNKTVHEKWFEWQAMESTVEMFAVLVVNGAEHNVVGVCGLTSIDSVNGNAEFSLYIRPGLHGNGYGNAALKTLFSHGFNMLRLNCIWGESYEGNPAHKLFTKVGMTEEGKRRELYYRNGSFVDAHLFSLLRSDWNRLLPVWQKQKPKVAGPERYPVQSVNNGTCPVLEGVQH